jgi:hypothetical protein
MILFKECKQDRVYHLIARGRLLVRDATMLRKGTCHGKRNSCHSALISDFADNA